MADVIIVGAGITGLSCAWRLKRLGIESLVLEGSLRAGGVIQSDRVGDYLIEDGPNSFLPVPENFSILDETRLTGELIEADPKAPRYICIGGTLHKAPFGALSLTGLLRAAGEIFVRSKSPKDESVHDFFARRFGSEVQDRLVAPFVTGIYAGNTKELEMKAAFPKFTAMERQHGSLILGMMKSKKPGGVRRGRTCSFAEGMAVLPRRLATDANIAFDARGVRVSRSLKVNWSFGEAQPRAVIVTAPAFRALSILEQDIPNVARLLEDVDYAPMVIATTSVPDRAFPQPLRGFGFLVPRTEKLHLLGTLFSSALFPGRAPAGQQLLTSFIGGCFDRDAIHWTDDRIRETVRSELHGILKTSVAPDPIRITRHSHAIPQYKIGHGNWLTTLKNELECAPGLFMAGNYLDGVAVSSCIDTGERVAREVAAFIRSN